MMTLHLLKRTAYGTTRFYPNCKLSRAIVRIGKKPTLTEVDIISLAAAGLSFEYTVDEEYNLSMREKQTELARKGGLTKKFNALNRLKNAKDLV